MRGPVFSSSAAAEDYEIFVDEGQEKTLSAVTDTDVAALLTGDKSRTLLKTGKGRLILSLDLSTPGYKGKVQIKEGFLRFNNALAFGTKDGGVVVEDGATLECDGKAMSESHVAQNEPLTFGGFGADGHGCVKMVTGSKWGFFSGSLKTMTSDALWNGESGRTDIRGKSTFDMNGHTLFMTNGATICEMTIVNPGKIVACEEGGSVSPSLEAGVKLGADASKEFVIGGAKYLNVVDVASGSLTWTLAVSNSVVVQMRNTGNSCRTNLTRAVTYNRWEGPVYLAEGAELSAWTQVDPATAVDRDAIYTLFSVCGKVSGPGSLGTYENGSGRYGYLRVTHPENDFTGGVNVRKGTLLEAMSVGSLGTGPVTVADSGKLVFLNGSEWDTNTLDSAELGRVLKLKDQFYRGKGYYYSTPQIAFPTLGSGTYAGALDGTIDIFHHETNVLTLAGTITGSPKVLNAAGTLEIAGPGVNRVGSIYVPDGTVKIADGTKVYTGDDSWMVSGIYPRCPRLVIGENAEMISRDDSSSTKLPVQIVGGVANGPDGTAVREDFSRGIVEILPGALVTNVMTVGYGGEGWQASMFRTNNMGAVYMRGGTLAQRGDNSRDLFQIGWHSNGYFEMSDGYWDATKGTEWIRIGGGVSTWGHQTPGHGVVHVKGGLMAHRSVGFGVDAGGGYGHLRVSGGVVSNTTMIVGLSLWVDKTGGEGVVTVDGQGLVDVYDRVTLGGLSNSVSILNLNGGKLAAKWIQGITNQCQASGAGNYPLEFANNPAYVNFNGGTFRTTNESDYPRQNWLRSATRYTLFAGGVTLDVGTKDRDLLEPLEAPSGKGVRSVDFSCDEPWRYIGSPYVRIVDPSGTGYGASAFADFDSTNGVITGVTVTSAGCDYGPDTYAEIAFGGWTNTLHVAVTLAENAPSGDFAKKGSGQLRQCATNASAGVVRVLEGSLLLNAPDVYPNVSGFEVAEGAELANGNGAYPYPSGTLKGTGTIQGDFTLTGKLTVEAADLIAGKCLACTGKLTIGEGAVLEVLHPELLTEAMRPMTVVRAEKGIGGTLAPDTSAFDANWRVSKSTKTIRFGYGHGLLLIVR